MCRSSWWRWTPSWLSNAVIIKVGKLRSSSRLIASGFMRWFMPAQSSDFSSRCSIDRTFIMNYSFLYHYKKHKLSKLSSNSSDCFQVPAHAVVSLMRRIDLSLLTRFLICKSIKMFHFSRGTGWMSHPWKQSEAMLPFHLSLGRSHCNCGVFFFPSLLGLVDKLQCLRVPEISLVSP